MLHLTVNGHAFLAQEGTLLLDALQQQGVNIPHLCHDSRLLPFGGCRLCMVEVEGMAQAQASCCLPVSDGMVVHTHTPALEAVRHTNLQLLADNCPPAVVNPDQPFGRLLQQYGIDPQSNGHRDVFQDDSHPYIGVAMDRCVYCQLCIRVCDEVQGQFVWAAFGRGSNTRIAPVRDNTLQAAGCVSCGACVDCCPSGALFDKQAAPSGVDWIRTTCGYCGVGCQMDVAASDGKISAVRGAKHPVNNGHLCVKGRYAHAFNHAADRISQPMIKQHGQWYSCSWDEALDAVAEGFSRTISQAGNDSVGVLGSARASNEDNYLLQKFARLVLGTNNVDCCARVCHTPSAKALKTMLGTGAASNSFDDIERANGFLLCGCNPTENHPIVGARIRQAVLKGASLVVIDPRHTELTTLANVHLAIRPGSNVLVLNAMAATILEEDLLDRQFVATRVSDMREFTSFIGEYAPEKVATACGVPASDIRAAARCYANNRPGMCFHGLGMTEHLQGTEGVMCLINLALLTGNLGKPGAGINPLRGQNNVQGAAQMGCDPHSLTGAQSFSDAGPSFAARWGKTLPKSNGLDVLQMMDAARDGKLRALWVCGYDIYLTLANEAATAKALASLEMLVIQDLFLNETAQKFGHIFLPAASFFEKEGTFMNSDRRVQRIRRVVPPFGNSRPDGDIVCDVAARMGYGKEFTYQSPQAVWDEIRQLWPAGAGLSYSRLEQENLHWPCPNLQHPGTPILHCDSFTGSKTATLAQIHDQPSLEQTDDDYPLLLMTGRVLSHFNAGTMTYRTDNAVLHPTDTLDMAPVDAAELGLRQGDRVLIKSRYGSATLQLRITDTMQKGQLFSSFHRHDLFVNRLTSNVRDRMVNTPEYKLTAVCVTRHSEMGADDGTVRI